MVLAVDSCLAIARCEPVPTRERIALSLSLAGIHGLDLTWPNVTRIRYQAVASHARPSQPRLCNRHAISSSPRPTPRLTLGLVRPPALPWWVVTQCPAKTGTLTPRHTPLYISPFPLFFLPLASPSLNC